MFSKLRSKSRKEEQEQKETEPELRLPQHAQARPIKQYDYLFKVILIGDDGVGKNSIISRFTEDSFTGTFISTIGIDFKIQMLEVNGKKVKLQIWDTPGQERFKIITTSYYRGCMGVMIVFDVTNMKSFKSVGLWLKNIDEHAPSDVCKILVGNNCHETQKREVDCSTAREFAEQCGLLYFEVSAKTALNVEEAFFFMTQRILRILAKKEGRTEESHFSCKKINRDQQITRQPDDKLLGTHQRCDNAPSDIQLPHSQIQGNYDKSTDYETQPKKETSVQQDLKRQEAEERVQLFKGAIAQYQQQIKDKNKEIHQICKRNEDLEDKLHKLEENIQAMREELHKKELLTAKNLQDLQSQLKQSGEAIQGARQQVKEKEQQALRQTETIKTLEVRVKELEEEGTETQQHITELEEQLHQAELRLKNSDQLFQDIFQRLLGQLPQSQPHWVVQRNEIQLTGEELGTGGWASVKVALFRSQRVAAKCLHNQIISAHNIRLFTREMTMAACARHPNLLQFIGDTMDNNPIILTELMPTSLRHILEEGVHLSHIQIISIASDVARALNYLHLNTPDPIIHRDISSANVLLEQFGEKYKAKVSDYGSANFSRYTSTAGPGNPLYSAPESGDPSRQSVKMDIYSFGLLLIEMCSGELFDDHEELIRTHINDWPEIVCIIRPCIRRDPKRRPNMDSVLAQLNQIWDTFNLG